MRPMRNRAFLWVVLFCLCFTPLLFATQAEGAKRLIDLEVEEGPQYATVVLYTDGEVQGYKPFFLQSPPRLVIDLPGVKRSLQAQRLQINSPFLRAVRFGDYPEKLRVVLDLPEGLNPCYQVQRAAGGLRVHIGRALPEGGSAPVDPLIQDFGFRQMKEVSRVFLKVKEGVKYSLRKGKEEVVLQLPGCTFPKRFLRPLDTSQFNSSVLLVKPLNVRGGAKVVVQLRKMVPVEVIQKGDLLALDFARVGAFAKQRRPKPVKRVVKRKKRVERAPAFLVERLMGEEKVYTGKRISLDLKDVELPNVFRLFADISGMNILVTDDVRGRVTLRLVDVPWDQALDIILETHNLGMEKVGNVIRISTLQRLQKEKEARAKAVKAKETLEPLVTELMPISYSKASELAPKVKDLLSPRGSVSVDERTNILIVKDVREKVEEARELVRRLDSQTPQVLIDAKIVEASTEFKKELGISWGGRINASWGGDEARLSGGTEGTLKEAGTTDYVVNLPAAVEVGEGGALNLLVGNLPARFFEVKLSAMEKEGLGKIISSPRVTTLDHKEAYIEQGVRIPYLKLTEEGTVSTEFIDATLKLTVTPHVTADGHVRMEIECSKETPDWSRQVMGEPTIKKSKAKTEVMAKNGEVVVLGGIYEYDKTGSTHGVPGLKDIPLLGWFFKKKTREQTKRELMIFIAPRIVAPRELAAKP